MNFTITTKVLLSIVALGLPLFWFGKSLLSGFARAFGSAGDRGDGLWVALEFRIIGLVIFFTVISLLLGFILKGKYSGFLFFAPFLFLAVGLVSNNIIGGKLIHEYVQIIEQTQQAGRLLLDEELKLYPEDFRRISSDADKISGDLFDYINLDTKTGDLRRIRVHTGGNNRELHVLEIDTIGRLTGNKIEFFEEFWVDYFAEAFVGVSEATKQKEFKYIFLKDQTVASSRKVF